jgi:multiple sugar transport system permease protein
MVEVMRRFSTSLTITLLLFVTLFPVLWTFLGSFKTLKDIVTPVPVLFFTPTLANYAVVLSTPAVQLGLMNSVIVVGCSVGIGMLFGIPAAHALARDVFGLRDKVMFYVLSLRFLPPVAIAIPFIALYLDLGIHDTRGSLILTYCLTTISTMIWLGVPAFEQVPRDIEEAASLEGCSEFQIFCKISLPVALPSLIGAVLFTFVIVWNELLIALSLTSQNFTLPVVAATFTMMGMEVPWGIINASSIVLAIPPLLFIGLIMQFVNRFFRVHTPVSAEP